MRSINYKNVFKKACASLVSAAMALLLVPAVPQQAHAADGWDGQTVQEPSSSGAVYQVSCPEELAWVAQQVNSGAQVSCKATLTDDIDLNGAQWTPIGSSTSRAFTGSFDGAGHTISGLNVDAASYAPAGLFGLVKNATIKGVTINGQVVGENSTIGGVVARSEGTTAIENCGNLASVENKASSGRAAGIVGWVYDGGTITGCFNRGSITSSYRAAGIVAEGGSSGTTVSNCYNTGSVSGNPAYGIGHLSVNSSYENCYNAGQVVATGSSTADSIGHSGSAGYENCFYLEGACAGDATENGRGEPMSATDMKRASFVEKLGSDAWQIDAGSAANGGFPLLSWEPQAGELGVELAAPADLAWTPNEGSAVEGADLVFGSNAVSWGAVTGADGYRVKLYTADDAEHVLLEEEVTECTYDFYDAFAGLAAAGTAEYVFTVTALGDGVAYLDSTESAPSAPFLLDADAFIAAPENLLWNEASKIGIWEAVPQADFYTVALFFNGSKSAEFTLDREVLSSEGGKLSFYFVNQLAGKGEYYFTVRAGRNVASGPNTGKTAVSALAVSATTSFEAGAAETVKISSADEWMAIVNMDRSGTDYVTDADAQRVAWARNYELTADLDFSHLSAEQQVQTKSWGNIDANFNGHFDGKGHKVTGLTLSAGDAGLFAYIGQQGVVENLIVDSANVLFSDNAAVMCYYNYGTIRNCGVVNTNITADSGAIIGGFVSRNWGGGAIEGCYVQGGRMTTNSATANGHGGFVGMNAGIIKRCWSSMDIESASFCEGGFCGWAEEHFDKDTSAYVGSRFEDCFTLGDVSAKRGWCGGFVGRVNSSRAVFKNCYAANTVTSEERPGRAYGFFGSFGSEAAIDLNGSGAFNITLPADNVINCSFASDLTARDRAADAQADGKECPQTTAVTRAQMATPEFAQDLGAYWSQDSKLNGGLPYLDNVVVPQKAQERDITVQIAIALYDTNTFEFSQMGQTLSVTMPSTGNTRVIDVLQEAQRQGLLNYRYTVTPAYGSFIEEINGHALYAPDGWMFTVNDELSSVGVQLASVGDGDQILWYEGTTQNLFAAPAWKDVTGTVPKVNWIDIGTPDELAALCSSDADMAASYRLSADIDMEGVEFTGVGTGATPFTGVFDGAGHTVSNVTIDLPQEHNVGFFRVVRGAQVRNLRLENAHVTGLYTVGAMIGYAAVVLDVNDRANQIGNRIGNCAVSGTVVATNDDVSASSDGSYAGGFIGFNDGDTDNKTKISIYSSVDNCSADVEVTAHAIYAGGFAGGNFGYITNCAAAGAVSGANCVGGFVGGNSTNVYDSSATGAVTGNDHVGGFVGSSYTAVERSYSTGNVTGYGSYIGGFAGTAGGSLKDCSSAGAVASAQSGEYAGGFTGHYTGTFTGLAWQITFSGNHGWCCTQAGDTLKAIGNHGSSTLEAEQAVLDATQVTDWSVLQQAFLDKHNVELDENGEVTVPKREVDLDALTQAVYEKLKARQTVDAHSAWVLADIVRYERLTGTADSIGNETKQAFVDYIAAAAQERNAAGRLRATAGDLAKYIIGLRAIGADPRAIVLADGDERTPLDLVSRLKSLIGGAAFAKQGVNVEPFILLALSEDAAYATDAEIGSMVDTLLGQQGADGLWESPDATGFAVAALARFATQRSDVAAAIGRAVSAEALVPLLDTYGAASYRGTASVESTAQLIVALAAAGADLDSVKTADGRTLLDGLSQFATQAEDGFEHDYGKTGDAFIATEQGFRALIARLMSKQNVTGPLYDFSDVAAEPVHSTVARAGGLTDEELDGVRNAACERIESAVDVQDYRSEQQEELQAAIAAGKEAVQAATSVEEADAAVDAALEAIRAIPTAKELDKKDAAKARALIDAIDAVEADENGVVPSEVKKQIQTARAAYDALSDDAKALVKNLGALETAEELLAQLEPKNAQDEPAPKPGADTTKSDPAVGSVNAITPTDTAADAAKQVSSLKLNSAKLKVAGSVKKKTLTLTFAKVKGAKNYRVAYRMANAKKWSYVWTGGKASHKLKKLKKGSLVQVKVVAYAKNAKTQQWTRGAWSKVTYCWMATTKVTLKAAKGKLKVTAKKVKKATSYQVLRSYKKSMKNAKKTKMGKGAKKTLKKMKKGKKVYVQVVPLRTYGGHVYVGVASPKKSKAAK